MAKAPELPPDSRLAAADFDNTVALTFNAAPSGIGVHEAHELSIEDLFGLHALARYRAGGGLKNRTARAVVADLFPNATPDSHARMAQDLVNKKLSYMLDQIDGTWPMPTDGFLETWQALSGNPNIATAIISAGHEPFIKKTFDSWGLQPPDILVTEETIRSLAPGIAPEYVDKPRPFPMEVALGAWLEIHGAQNNLANRVLAAGQTTYIGDAPDKDGGMAANSGVEFVLLDPTTSAENWQTYRHKLGLGSIALAAETGSAQQ